MSKQKNKRKESKFNEMELSASSGNILYEKRIFLLYRYAYGYFYSFIRVAFIRLRVYLIEFAVENIILHLRSTKTTMFLALIAAYQGFLCLLLLKEINLPRYF